MTVNPASPKEQQLVENANGDNKCCIALFFGRVWEWIQSLIDPICDFFRQVFCCCIPPAPLPIQIDENVRSLILPPPQVLAEASETQPSKKLINLGSTCYLNSMLQLIARLNGFNSALMTPLNEIDRSGFDNDEDYQRAVNIRENKQLLKQHLSAIIHLMRTPATPQITRENLTTLFHLLQVCGWRKRPNEQQDPHELLMDLRDTLADEENLLHKVEALSYTYNDSDNVHFSPTENAREIAVELPSANSIETPCETMDDLIGNYLSQGLLEGYKPDEADETEEGICAIKQPYLVSPPPQTLFIHENRVGWDRNRDQPFRIQTAVPIERSFNPEIRLPFHRVVNNELIEDGTQLYRLKAVICHRGGSSANSGHYTTLTSLNVNEGGDEAWCHYNDAKDPQQLLNRNDRLPQAVSNKIKTDALYLAYERVD